MSAALDSSDVTVSTEAPGAPGNAPTWTTSAKDMIGCALGTARLWFTVGHGIINEVYYPRVDIPQIRDLGFVVADDNGFWVEVKRLDDSSTRTPAAGVPVVKIIHRHPRFQLHLRVAPDGNRDALLVEAHLEGDETLRLYALLAPHLGGTGHDNLAAIATYRGRQVLWAEQGPFGLALAAVDLQQRDAWRRSSAGYVGVSDGWQDFYHHGTMCWQYRRAGPGNVALTGELPREAVLALGLGSSKESAATLAISSLLQPFANAWDGQCTAWQAWHRERRRRSRVDELPGTLRNVFLSSAMVLRTHQDRIYPGAMVASLSVPWGNTGNERGGYHLVWPRDLVECAGALLALGAEQEARDVLRYLIATQNSDGHWYQNQWLGGKPYWKGLQLDEAAFPVLLAAMLAEREALDGIEVQNMISRALSFIARNGPASDQDRWEEDAGVNAFTLAVCIAALVSGAAFLDEPARSTALALADYWNAHIEAWTTASDTPLTRRHGIPGYYIRVAPVQALRDGNALRRVLPIKNRIHDPALPADEQIGVDFLQLVRFGLRRHDDPLILATVKLADAVLKVNTPSGPAWYRYNNDGYGEHRDGRPFDGAGRGRAWPLLCGERGHYELVAGHDPLPLLEAMTRMTGPNGLLPEQIWDTTAIPDRRLYPGRPSGSAMPLAWAHAEFIKLSASRALGRPFDRPAAVWERYRGIRPPAFDVFWCEQAPVHTLSEGKTLVIALYSPGLVHWSLDEWGHTADSPARDCGLGLYIATLPTQTLTAGASAVFTYRDGDGHWIGVNYRVTVTRGQTAA
jgi:glucoamylase